MRSFIIKFLIAGILVAACSTSYALTPKKGAEYKKSLARENAYKIASIPSPTRVPKQ